MKNIFLTILLLMSSLTCFGQSKFFDDLDSSTWTASSDISDMNLKSLQDISLAKLIYSKDSINQDVTIWTFRDSILTIVKYSAQHKTDSFMGRYKFSVKNKSILQIAIDEGTILNYRVGIVSSGFYASLYKLE